MIKCPNCSGEMSYDTTLQMVKCKYCGSLFTPEEIDEKMKVTEEKEEDSYEGKAYKCSQCGATLMTFDETAITFCSYCGSQAMLADKMVTNHNPDFVIPFKKTKEECINAYKKKVSKFLFAPSYMNSNMTVEKFRGIYMPYVIYDLKKQESFRNTGSKYACRIGDYVYYDDYSISADADVSYDGISYDLVSKFYDNYSTAIPFNYKDAVPFKPAYLAGYYADASDVNEDTYLDVANKLVKPNVEQRLKKYKEFQKYGCNKPTLLLKGDKKTGMFPAYFLAMRDKKNQNVSYAVVNGQTGKVAVDLPIDFKKYIVSSLLLAIILFLLINSFLVLTPNKVAVFSVISGIISLMISHYQSKKINAREKHLDDKGVAYSLKMEDKKNLEEKQSFKRADKKKEKKKSSTSMARFLYKEIIAIIIPIVTISTEPVSDAYFYGASVLSLLLIILSFYDLVKEHNMLTSHKLPQFEKRGGDENA